MIFYKLSFELVGEPPQIVQVYLEPQHKLICNAQSVWSVEAQILWETKEDDGVSEIIQEKTLKDSQADKIWEISEKNTKNNTKNSFLGDISTEDEIPKKTKHKKKKAQIEDIEKGFLEKLWGATKKSLHNFFPVPIQKIKNTPPKNKNIQIQEEDTPKEEPNKEEENIPEEATSLFGNAENSQEEPNIKEYESAESISKNIEKKWIFSTQLTHFYNPDQYIRTIVCGSEANGQVLCVDLGEMPNYKIVCKQSAFMIGRFGTKVSCFWKNESEKLAFLEIQGDDYIFLKSDGFLKEYYLEDDIIIIPLHKLLAFQDVLHFSEISQKNMLNTQNQTNIPLLQLTGRGKYWLG